MKILSAAQIREVDACTIAHEPIASLDLMERAAQAFTDWFAARYNNSQSVKVICGLGNNGGDGLAIARMLYWIRYPVQVSVVRHTDKTSADFAANFNRLPEEITVREIRQSVDIGAFAETDVVIDAIFGSGLSRPADGLAAEMIGSVNASRAVVVAVDMPSGLFTDKPQPGTNIIRAAHTVSFQLPKLAFLLPQNAAFVGDWHLLDIGLHQTAIEKSVTDNEYTDETLARTYLRKREKYSHKGTYGHALLVAGSHGKIGAAVLAARACLRAGTGLLTVHVPQCGYAIMQAAVPEAMTLTDKSENHFSEITDTESYTTIGIGPGLGTHEATAQALHGLLQRTRRPMVLDADALNILAQHPDWLALVPPGSILTPHPKEFERLAGKAADDYDRLDLARRLAAKYQATIVLKGAHTAVVLPSGRILFNSTGNPGMATGGTGDVLTGIVTALLAQGHPPEQAAVLGVYLHSAAGDKAARRKGQHSLIASDVVDFLPVAFMALQ